MREYAPPQLTAGPRSVLTSEFAITSSSAPPPHGRYLPTFSHGPSEDDACCWRDTHVDIFHAQSGTRDEKSGRTSLEVAPARWIGALTSCWVPLWADLAAEPNKLGNFLMECVEQLTRGSDRCCDWSSGSSCAPAVVIAVNPFNWTLVFVPARVHGSIIDQLKSCCLCYARYLVSRTLVWPRTNWSFS